MTRAAIRLLVSAVVAAALTAVPSALAAPEIRVLSNPADLVSGGDALVEVARADSRTMRVAVDRRSSPVPMDTASAAGARGFRVISPGQA